MKIECYCGHTIHDITDNQPHKAHLIPDERWSDLFDALDDLIERCCRTAAQRKAALMKIRMLIGRDLKPVWQCRECGRLYVNGKGGTTHCYAPEDETSSREVLRARFTSPGE